MKRTLVETYKSISGSIEFALNKFGYAKDELIVLCMHSTPADQMNHFTEMLQFLTGHFKPISASDIPLYFSGKMSDGPFIMFTFDDGLKNNLHVARLLAKKNIGAMFFLVPDFISSENQEKYYRTNIRQAIDPSFDKIAEDFSAMNAADITELVSLGHSIGSHTMSHLLRVDSNREMVMREVVESRNVLQLDHGFTIDSFCSPIDSLFSINQLAKELINTHYRFHYTTFPGLNAMHKNPHLIFRRNIEVNWSLPKIKFALGRWDLNRWVQRIQQFEQL